jgi:glycerol kinase
MNEPVVLAIDQGTTNTKALLVDSSGGTAASASEPVGIAYPRPGWVEQDPDAIWASVRRAVERCLAARPGQRPAAVAVANQRESVLAWDRETGRAQGPCVTWQCRRGAALVDRLRRRGVEDLVRKTTGLTLDPMFSASKARWLLDHLPDGSARAEDGDLCLGTVDSWLLWKLTGGAVHACDSTNASRTQLLNLREMRWDSEMADLFGIPLPALPEIRPSSGIFGHTAESDVLPADVPVAGLVGDSHGAFFGHAALTPGNVKATYGTGSSLMMSTSQAIDSLSGLSSTIAFTRPGQVVYALEGNIYATGAAVEWMSRLLGLEGPAELAKLAESAGDTGGVYLVPAFVGLGAPHWKDRARGLMTGMTRGTGRAQAARAAIEAVAYQIHDVFAAMERDAAAELPALLADGGASRNDQLMQFQADILGRPVLRNASRDLSAMGAAYLAGLAVGVWKSLEEIENLPRPRDRFEPRLAEDARRSLLEGWRRAVARASWEDWPAGGG